MTNHEELLLLGTLLDCSDADEFAAIASTRPKLEARRRALLGLDPRAQDGATTMSVPSLADLLSSDAEFAGEVSEAVARHAIDFVHEQVDHLLSVKDERSLTPEELRFCREELTRIVDSLPKLVGDE
jgi:hypothetical protein